MGNVECPRMWSCQQQHWKPKYEVSGRHLADCLGNHPTRARTGLKLAYFSCDRPWVCMRMLEKFAASNIPRALRMVDCSHYLITGTEFGATKTFLR
jgi:hypothetical protein